ncbi:MAG: LON peptidase substrate-binding domain-containing protein [Gemmatimonadaceae bacterium]|nr:LON peptidase substrate-binding domain-containing protein [Gemmatimonadaceae bacterium]
MSRETLPLFPLGVVLFPGTALPLHIFEPRYRQMLADIRAGNSRFGLLTSIEGVEERDLPAGRVGCVAEVTDVEMLPDGRANIVVRGRERIALDQFVEARAPYHVGDVDVVPDIPDTNAVALTVQAGELAAHFRRVVAAVQRLNKQTNEPPTLPDAAAQLPWAIAAMIDLDVGQRYELLAERNPAKRLAQIDAVIRRVLPDLELRAAIETES